MQQFQGKKIMVLGAGVFQLPAIEKAKQMGCEVIALSWSADDPGMSLATKSYACSTRDIDEAIRIGREEGIDGVMTLASEVAVPTAAAVAEELGLPGIGIETAQLVYHKGKLMKLLERSGVVVPEFWLADTMPEILQAFQSLPKPVVIKPVQGSGSRGVFKVNTEDELLDRFEQCKASSLGDRQVLAGGFIPEPEYGGEMIVAKGQVAFLQATRKSVNEYFVPIQHLLSRPDTDALTEEVKPIMERIVNALNLTNALINFDLRRRDNELVLVDLGIRLGGNGLPDLMELHTGVDTVTAAIALALGEEIETATVTPGTDHVAVYIIGSERDGKVSRLTKPEEVLNENLVSARMNHKIGDEVSTLTEGSKHLGHVIFKGDSAEQLLELAKLVHHTKWVELND